MADKQLYTDLKSIPKGIADGQIMLITGANSGMGLATSAALAAAGAEVIMLCRNGSRGKAALDKARELSGSDKLHLMLADLANFDSVTAFAKVFSERFDRLDALVNNAGVIVLDRQETKQGLELQFGVNHLGHFLLTMQLSPLLLTTDSARLVNVSSGAHKIGKIHFEDINLRKHYNVIRSYSQSKLANILFTQEFANRTSGRGITSVSCHPGAVATQMGIDRQTGFGRGLTSLLKPFFRTPSEGAATAIQLALHGPGAGNNGKYFYNGQPAQTSKRANDQEAARKLWQLSLELVSPWLNGLSIAPELSALRHPENNQ